MFRNLFHIIRKFKLASLLNVLGLSIAFASFILIMIQVRYDETFNHCHKDYDRIVRVELNMGDNTTIAVCSRLEAEAFGKIPEVEAVGEYFAAFEELAVTLNGNPDPVFKESRALVSEGYPKVFSFEMVEGTTSALEEPMNVIIPESMARKFFPDGQALGNRIGYKDSTMIIGGVYKDFPTNSTVKNHIFECMDDDHDKDGWGKRNYNVYLLLRTPEMVSMDRSVIAKYHEEPQSWGYGSKEELAEHINDLYRFTPLDDVYYNNQVLYDFGERGSRQTTILLICIAFVIIIIAGINFTNFSTSLAPMRIKSINTQKVLGCPTSKLRSSLSLEAVFISFLAFIVSIGFVFLCKGTYIETLLSSGIDLSSDVVILIVVGIISIITGLAAGIYPAFYLTSFQPAMVLKGSFGLSPRGRRLRTGLLCFQYIASIGLLIVASFLFIQNRYMIHSDYGYDNDRIITVRVNERILKSQEAFMNELRKQECFESVGFTMMLISSMDDYSGWGTNFKEQQISYNALMGTYGFPATLGLTLSQGRLFTESDGKTEQGAYIFNQTAVDQYGIELGDILNGAPVVGIVEDIQYSTFRRPIGPMAFVVIGTDHFLSGFSDLINICYIRVKEGFPLYDVMDKVRTTLVKFDPTYPFDINPLDTEIKNAYQTERHVSALVTIFSILTIFISIVGIFGLIIFETEYKKREIGVRKVFGSTTSEIMTGFSMNYVKMLLFCSAFAIPISYFLVAQWLERFTHRTPIYWWVFVLAVLLITLITLATITYQNYKAAHANPVDSLKAE